MTDGVRSSGEYQVSLCEEAYLSMTDKSWMSLHCVAGSLSGFHVSSTGEESNGRLT